MTTTRLSLTNNNLQANGNSSSASVSADGRYLVFASNATNLVSGDANNASDIFLKDRITGLIKLISKGPGAPGSSDSLRPVISANGRYVAYESYATNLVAGDTNNALDIFRYDRVTGTTALVSVDSANVQANGDSSKASISDDGNLIAFASAASNLVGKDTNGAWDVFVRNMAGNATTRESMGAAATEGDGDSLAPAISGNGGFVAFVSSATNLVANDTNGRYDVFVRNRAASATTRESIRSGIDGAQANNDSWQPYLSQDGRYLVYSSAASNLASKDTNGANDIFRRDRVAKTTRLSSITTDSGRSNGHSFNPRITNDGRYVAFESYGVLANGDNNAAVDVYLRDHRASKRLTTLLSVSTDGAIGNGESKGPAMSSDGRYVLFESFASNLVKGDTNAAWDVFVQDRGVGSTPSYPLSKTANPAD